MYTGLVIIFNMMAYVDLPREDEHFLSQLEKRQAAMVAKLGSQELWTDPGREGELLELLQVCQTLKPPGCIPILAKHMTYEIRDKVRKLDAKSVEQQYPAVGVLEKIGLPAVPALLAAIGRGPAKDSGTAPGPTETILVHCLIRIYDRGGYGSEMARKRIETEVAKAMGKDKARLEQALSNLAFK
jgi:hypothetical protein